MCFSNQTLVVSENVVKRYIYFKLSIAGNVEAGGRNEVVAWRFIFFDDWSSVFYQLISIVYTRIIIGGEWVRQRVCSQFVVCFITTGPMRTHAPIHYIILYNIITRPILYGRTIGKRKSILIYTFI